MLSRTNTTIRIGVSPVYGNLEQSTMRGPEPKEEILTGEIAESGPVDDEGS